MRLLLLSVFLAWAAIALAQDNPAPSAPGQETPAPTPAPGQGTPAPDVTPVPAETLKPEGTTTTETNPHELVVPKDGKSCYVFVADASFRTELAEHENVEFLSGVGSRVLKIAAGHKFFWSSAPVTIDIITRPGTTWQRGVTLAPGNDEKCGFHCEAGGVLRAGGFVDPSEEVAEGAEHTKLSIQPRDVIYIGPGRWTTREEYEAPVEPSEEEKAKVPACRFYHLLGEEKFPSSSLFPSTSFCSPVGVCDLDDTTILEHTASAAQDYYQLNPEAKDMAFTDFYSVILITPRVTPEAVTFVCDPASHKVTSDWPNDNEGKLRDTRWVFLAADRRE